MAANWGKCVFLASCLAVMMAGCRTPTPNLKPANVKEQLVSPPAEGRYEQAGYPKQAFDPPSDPTLQTTGGKNNPPGSRGGMNGGGMGGMGGMNGMGPR